MRGRRTKLIKGKRGMSGRLIATFALAWGAFALALVTALSEQSAMWIGGLLWIAVAWLLAAEVLRKRPKRSEPRIVSRSLPETVQDIDFDAAAGVGEIGEKRIEALLRDAGFECIRDIILQAPVGETQIDILAKVGGTIAVLEIKAWSGRIEGTMAGPTWSRVRADGGRDVFQNPIVQNRRHADAVRSLLPDGDIRSFIVMAGGATFPGAPAQVLTASRVAEALLTLAAGRKATERSERDWRKLKTIEASAAQKMARHRHRAFMEKRRTTFPQEGLQIMRG